MMPYPANCWKCARYDEKTSTCEAFPEFIPDDIFEQGNPHTKEVKGDHGLHFKPKRKD